MDKIRDINFSPDKLRVKYTLGSKSSRLVNLKRPVPKSDTPTESILTKTQIIKNKSSSLQTDLQLAKLQQELDSEELSIQFLKYKQMPEEEKLNAELKIYENYLEKTIQMIAQKDSYFGKALERGWKGYRSYLSKKLLHSPAKPEKEKKVTQFRDQASQKSEETASEVSEDIESYISYLHKAIKGVNRIQIDRIIETLKDLSTSMKPLEIPEPTKSLNVEELDFTDTIKSIHTKLKARIKKPDPQEDVKTSLTSVYTQTYLTLEDFRSAEVYKLVVVELEGKLEDASTRLKRKEEEIDEALLNKIKELEDVRRKYLDSVNSVCYQCKIKRSMLENSNSQIKGLQLSVQKGILVQKELEKAKQLLVESKNLIMVKDKKITELNTNVQDLLVKIEKNNEIRENIEKQLEESTRELETVIDTLEQSEKIRRELEARLLEENLIIESLERKIQIASEQVNKNNLLVSGNQTPPKLILSHRNKSKTHRVRTQAKTHQTKTPPPVSAQNFSPLNNLNVSNLNISAVSQLNQSNLNLARQVPKDFKRKTVMQILQISKEEYLSLSKKTRIDLFECLFEHREKCGADCEHLKRAMLLRQLDRGQLFPTKKYNIS